MHYLGVHIFSYFYERETNLINFQNSENMWSQNLVCFQFRNKISPCPRHTYTSRICLYTQKQMWTIICQMMKIWTYAACPWPQPWNIAIQSSQCQGIIFTSQHHIGPVTYGSRVIKTCKSYYSYTQTVYRRTIQAMTSGTFNNIKQYR
jgi:hypothetical protein